MFGTNISIEAPENQRFETALGMVLSSANRGKLIKVVGRSGENRHEKEYELNIYTGLITRTDNSRDENYTRVYYLTAYKENYIVVHKDKLKEILDACNEV